MCSFELQRQSIGNTTVCGQAARGFANTVLTSNAACLSFFEPPSAPQAYVPDSICQFCDSLNCSKYGGRNKMSQSMHKHLALSNSELLVLFAVISILELLENKYCLKQPNTWATWESKVVTRFKAYHKSILLTLRSKNSSSICVTTDVGIQVHTHAL